MKHLRRFSLFENTFGNLPDDGDDIDDNDPFGNLPDDGDDIDDNDPFQVALNISFSDFTDNKLFRSKIGDEIIFSFRNEDGPEDDFYGYGTLAFNFIDNSYYGELVPHDGEYKSIEGIIDEEMYLDLQEPDTAADLLLDLVYELL